MPFLGKEPAFDLASTSDLGDNVVTEAKLKDALVGDFTEVTATASDSIILGDATDSGNTKRDTIQGVLDLVSAGFTQPATQTATSGASKVFGSIPSGTKMIVISYFNISSNNAGDTGALRLVLGDGGGLESSGYISMRAQLRSSANVIFDDTANFELSDHLDVTSSFRGSCICTLQDASTFRWIAQWQTMDTSNAATVNVGCGSKALSAELTQVALQTSDAFDDSAGSISIMYM